MKLLRNTWKHKQLLLMALPGIILIIMFNYMPMYGQIIAFKKFNYNGGIWGSPWVGFDNFKFLFANGAIFGRIVRNTVGYYLLFTIVGTVCNITLAIGLYECVYKRFTRFSQTLMIMPAFVSYIAVTFIAKALLDSPNGFINHILMGLGNEPIQFYMQAKYWPVILTIVNVWKGTGYGSILYLSALTGMDVEMFEAAQLDGASKGQQIRYITLPMLTNMIAILLLLGLGGIMTSNTGLFYQVTRNIGILYSTTQTIDAYVMNALIGGSTSVGSTNAFGMTAAVTFFQSVVGCVMVVTVNLIVKKYSPESSIF